MEAREFWQAVVALSTCQFEAWFHLPALRRCTGPGS